MEITARWQKEIKQAVRVQGNYNVTEMKAKVKAAQEKQTLLKHNNGQRGEK